MINDQGKSRQIDHIAITEYGVFVIETKYYSGSIYGKENSEEWIQYLGDKKYHLKNPIYQNYGHYKIVKKIIFDEKVYIEPIVVFIDGCSIHVATHNKVIFASMIEKYIQRKSKILSENRINELYNIIMENRITDKETIQNHDFNVQKYNEFKNKMVDLGVCPKCESKLVLRDGKNGKFYGCSSYPKCRFVKNI